MKRSTGAARRPGGDRPHAAPVGRSVASAAREEALLAQAVARMRAGVMAVVFAMVGGAVLFLATAWLLVRGGPNVGQHLGLLRHYFPGYSVTWAGAFLGLLYGAAVGGVTGWVLARIYNRIANRRDPFRSEQEP